MPPRRFAECYQTVAGAHNPEHLDLTREQQRAPNAASDCRPAPAYGCGGSPGSLTGVDGAVLAETLAAFTQPRDTHDQGHPGPAPCRCLGRHRQRGCSNQRPLGSVAVSILVDLERICRRAPTRVDGWHPLGADTFDLLSCAAAYRHLRTEGERHLRAARPGAEINAWQGRRTMGRADRQRPWLHPLWAGTAVLPGHHIHHWKNGGRTDLSNLALCVRDAITICTWVATSSPWTRTRFPSSPRPGDRRGPSVRGLHGPGDLRPWLLKKHRDAS